MPVSYLRIQINNGVLTRTGEYQLKKISAIILAALSLCQLASCGGDSSQGSGRGHMYNASLLNNPQSLDPQFAQDPSSATVISNLYSGLMKYDSDGNLVCCNALSYDISEDETVYTFHLREDNNWFFDSNDNDKIENGEYFPVTADDYVFAFRRILDPDMKSPYAEQFSCIKNGESAIKGNTSSEYAGVYADDSFTLRIELEYPSAEFINLLATNAACPCNEDFFLATKGRYGLDDKSVMSNGAFFVRQWFYDPYGSNNILYMKKNSVNSYEDDMVSPSYLSFTIEKNQSDIAELFKSGDINCMTVMNKGSYNSKKYNIDAVRGTTLGLIFNRTDRVCSDINFRQALACATDRNFANSQMSSDVTVAYGIIPPAVQLLGRSYRDLTDDSAIDCFDEKKAQSCMQTAKNNLNIQTFDSIKILVNNDNLNTSYLHLITQRWQDILGVYIGIEEVSSADFNKRLESGDYQIALYPLKGCCNSGISTFEALSECRYTEASAKLKENIDNMKKCAASSDLVELFSNAERQAVQEYSFIPVFYKNEYLISSKECDDIIFDVFSGAVNFREAKYYD